LEEEIVYPVLEEEVDPDLAEEAQQEHAAAKGLIAEIEAMEPGDPQLRQAVRMLMNAVRHHVEEEESEMLPQSEEILGKEELARLGEEMAARKRQLGAD
jgi:hemerythrin-like domain-containing protein